MKSLITPLTLILLAAPLCAQESDSEKRIADLEKKVAKLAKAEPKKEEAKKDEGVSVKFGGRFHLDSVFYDGSENRLPTGTFMRRARISFKAGLGKNWVGEGDIDFAESIVNIKDMWVGYQGIKNTLIQAGQYKQPFGMDTLGSSNATWLMERSYSDVWTPERKMGLGYQTWGERWQAKAGFFGQNIDDTGDAQESADAGGGYKLVDHHGWGYAARMTFAPILISETKAMHLGVAYTQRTPNQGAPDVYEVDFSGRPEANKVSKAKFLNAKVTNVKNFNQVGAELAGVWGAFSWQAEYQLTNVIRRGEQQLKWDSTALKLVATSASEKLASVVDHKFSTYYVQASWIFGGQRTYEVSEGLFGKVAPSSRGAWEIVARYSTMKQDDLTAIDPVKGGIAKNITLGLTYYLNKNVRFMLNHTKVDNNENAMANKAFSPTGVKIPNDDFATTSMRVQVNF